MTQRSVSVRESVTLAALRDQVQLLDGANVLREVRRCGLDTQRLRECADSHVTSVEVLKSTKAPDLDGIEELRQFIRHAHEDRDAARYPYPESAPSHPAVASIVKKVRVGAVKRIAADAELSDFLTRLLVEEEVRSPPSRWLRVGMIVGGLAAWTFTALALLAIVMKTMASNPREAVQYLPGLVTISIVPICVWQASAVRCWSWARVKGGRVLGSLLAWAATAPCLIGVVALMLESGRVSSPRFSDLPLGIIFVLYALSPALVWHLVLSRARRAEEASEAGWIELRNWVHSQLKEHIRTSLREFALSNKPCAGLSQRLVQGHGDLLGALHEHEQSPILRRTASHWMAGCAAILSRCLQELESHEQPRALALAQERLRELEEAHAAFEALYSKHRSDSVSAEESTASTFKKWLESHAAVRQGLVEMRLHVRDAHTRIADAGENTCRAAGEVLGSMERHQGKAAVWRKSVTRSVHMHLSSRRMSAVRHVKEAKSSVTAALEEMRSVLVARRSGAKRALNDTHDSLIRSMEDVHASVAAQGRRAGEMLDRARRIHSVALAEALHGKCSDLRRVGRIDELRRKASSVIAEVDAALHERKWSVAVAPPASAAFVRMSQAKSDPQSFDQARILRYRHSDFIRIGTSHATIEGVQLRPLPLLLQLYDSPLLSMPRHEIVPVRGARVVVVRGEDRQRAEIADSLVRQLALRALGLRSPGLVKLMVIDPLKAGAAFREIGQLQGIAFDRADLAADPYGANALLQRLREEMTTTILSSASAGERSLDDSLARSRLTTVAFRVLCVFGFPRGFDETSVAQLTQICRSGAQAGVHVLLSLHDDEMRAMQMQEPSILRHGPFGDSAALHDEPKRAMKMPAPSMLRHDPFGDSAAWITVDDASTGRAHMSLRVAPQGTQDRQRVPLTLDPPFTAVEVSLLSAALRHDHDVKDATRVSPVQMAARLRRSDDLGTAREVLLAIGTAADEGSAPVTIPLGRDIAHHALLVGATGSGKTRLIQGMVAEACLRYGPEDLQFWLLDFKSGTGFKPFASASVPHCGVIGLSSDVTYGLDALDKLVSEMGRRQVLFKRLSVENLEQYSVARTGPATQMPRLPRVVAIIDEFQTLLGRDSASAASVRMAQIVQKGRSAGIHLFLATQSLEGQAGHIESLRSQIKVNIVLQSSASTQRGVLDRDEYASVHKLRRFEGLLDVDGRKTIFDVLDMPDSSGRVNPNLADALAMVSPTPATRSPALVYDGDADLTLPSIAEFGRLSVKVRARRSPEGMPLIVGTPAAVDDLPAYAVLRNAVNGNIVISTASDALLEVQLAAVALSVCAAEEVDHVVLEILQPDRMSRMWREIKRALPPKVLVREHQESSLPALYQSLCDELPPSLPRTRKLVVVREWTLLREFQQLSYGLSNDPVVQLLTRGPLAGTHVVAMTASGRDTTSDMRDHYSVRLAAAQSQELARASGFNPVAVSRMFLQDSARIDACQEYLPFSHPMETTHVDTDFQLRATDEIS